ncbi:hypothetical protein I3843_16G115500 [Carya illinoinensis]|nr:hypothetical protein I3843_16G115500 [Carya illinoinensis]
MENSSSSVSSNIEDSSPYHLQNGDSPGSILVSNLLIGDNYSSWYRSMEMTLKAKNKISFFNETIVYAKTTKDMWDELKYQFSQGNGPQIFQSKLVSVYYQKFKCLWDELMNYNQMPSCTCAASKLCACGATLLFVEYQQCQHVIMFLMGLNEDFAHVRGQNLLLEPLPSITKVFSFIIQEEKQREVGPMERVGFESNVAFMNKRVEGLKVNTGKQEYRKEKVLCTQCGMTNHIVDKCYKLHGYPPSYKQKGKVSSANQVMVQLSSAPFDQNCMPFSQEQYQQLLALIRPQPTKVPKNTPQAANVL